MVQIGESQERNHAHPVGQVVRFAVVPKMNLPSFLRLAAPMGKAMTVIKITRKFIATNTVCILPMYFEKLEAKIPCRKTVAMKTP